MFQSVVNPTPCSLGLSSRKQYKFHISSVLTLFSFSYTRLRTTSFALLPAKMSTLQPSSLCSTCEAVIQASPVDEGYRPFKTARELLDAANQGCYVCWTISHTKRWTEATPETFQQGLEYKIATQAGPARSSDSGAAGRASRSKISDFLYSPLRRLFQRSSSSPPRNTMASMIRRVANATTRFRALIVRGGIGPEASGGTHSWAFIRTIQKSTINGLLLSWIHHAI